MSAVPEQPEEIVALPNGPARLMPDYKKDRFKLVYNGDAIFQGTVRVRRGDVDLPLKEAATRLFALSKSDGWDVVTQTIRVAVIGALPEDLILLKAWAIAGEDALIHGSAIHCVANDWQIAIESGPTITFLESANEKITLEAVGSEIILKFCPLYRAHHLKNHK